MIGYGLMYLIPLFGLLLHGRHGTRRASSLWWLIGIVFVLIIGLRHEVGGDWFRYLRHFELIRYLAFKEVIVLSDPAHYAVNWIVGALGGNIYYVNVVYASAIMAGTMSFCFHQPRPWLALLVAVPYLLVVVGMGYSRQAVALGFAMLGLVVLAEQRVRAFVFWVAVGALFHKSAVLLLPIAALAASRNRWLTTFLVGVMFALMYYLLVSPESDEMWKNYVELKMESDGAKIRVLMCAIPAAIFLLFRKRLTPDENERSLWTWLSILAICCLPLVTIASTAIDRIALYMLPIQLYVFSRVPSLGGENARARGFLTVSVITLYGLVLFVWLQFASHADHWVPYQNGLFADI